MTTWILVMVIFSHGEVMGIKAGYGDSKEKCEAAMVHNKEAAAQAGVAIEQKCFPVTIVADPPKKPDTRGGNS